MSYIGGGIPRNPDAVVPGHLSKHGTGEIHGRNVSPAGSSGPAAWAGPDSAGRGQVPWRRPAE